MAMIRWDVNRHQRSKIRLKRWQKWRRCRKAGYFQNIPKKDKSKKTKLTEGYLEGSGYLENGGLQLAKYFEAPSVDHAESSGLACIEEFTQGQ